MFGFQPTLKINGRELPGTSHLGVSMSYDAIAGVPAPRRDDNWKLHASSRSMKPAGMYAISVSGSYMTLIPSIRIGQIVDIECSLALVEEGYVAEVDLPRPAVPGSVMYFTSEGVMLTDEADFPTAFTTRWCPILTVMVTEFSAGGNSMAAEASWSFSAEELEPAA